MRSGLVVAVGGPNLDTFTNILWALDNHLSRQLKIEKVLVLESSDISEHISELPERIRLALGRDAELRIRMLGKDFQTMIPRVLVDGAKEVGREGLIVDLTTGTKTMSAVLYACASFSQLPHLYYINVHRRDTTFAQLWADPEADKYHELVALAPLKDVQELASQSFFDLVFYIEQLTKIEDGSPADLAGEVHQSTNQLRIALPLFFGNPPDYLSAMRAIGSAGEYIIGLILKVVQQIDPGKAPITATKLPDWSDQYRDSVKKGSAASPIVAIPGIQVLDTASRTLQHWRNAAAHRNPPGFSLSEVRTAMGISINLLQTVLAVGTVLSRP